jgi:hypothetical protein
MIKVDISKATKELKKLKKKLSHKEVAIATRMALNESIRKGRTEVKEAILAVYNLKSSRILDADRKKGLSLRLAQGNNLSAELDAGHVPANLASFNNVKQVQQEVGQNIAFASKLKSRKTKVVKLARIFQGAGIQVEVKKGTTKIISSAFTLGSFTNAKSKQTVAIPGKAIFARGKKGKPTFKFAKPRMPIDSISAVSVATAAQNVNAQDKYAPVVEQHLNVRMLHHLKRAVAKL